MAKYSITHACGHTCTHQLFGPGKDRDRKEQWLSERLCTDCWREAQERERQTAATAAATANFSEGYVALAGSESQIAWAEVIRRGFVTALEKALEGGRKNPSHASSPIIVPVLSATLDWAKGIASAKWWIDHRQGAVSSPVAALSVIIGHQAEPEMSEGDRIRHMLALSPHTTEQAAEIAGITAARKAAQEAAAKAEAEAQAAEAKNDALLVLEACKAEARAAGITGEVARWWNNDVSKVRVYLNGINRVIEMQAGKLPKETVRQPARPNGDSIELAAVRLWMCMQDAGITRTTV